jgi:hypothetical protein
MTMERFALATLIAAFVAVSGQAYAGATISDQRYWPNEVGPSKQNVVHHPENAFDSAMPKPPVERNQHRYEGGPKSND